MLIAMIIYLEYGINNHYIKKQLRCQTYLKKRSLKILKLLESEIR